MKQTAVEYLQEISKRRELDMFDFIEAKQMEREQIEQAFNSGMYNSEDYFDCRIEVDNSTRIPESQTYYNETYKHS